MERSMSNRRRVYSLEPNKIAQTLFATKYVNHLITTLMNIKKSISLDENDDSELQNLVKYEVDMALVMSTPGFAWSRALKDKLLSNTNVEKFHNYSFNHRPASLKCSSIYSSSPASILKNEATDSLPKAPAHNVTFEMKFCSNSNSKPKNIKSKRSGRSLSLPRTKKEASKQSDKKQIESRLKNLRSLLPGGKEMVVNDLLSEMGSYIICLELQVNILQCLVDTH